MPLEIDQSLPLHFVQFIGKRASIDAQELRHLLPAHPDRDHITARLACQYTQIDQDAVTKTTLRQDLDLVSHLDIFIRQFLRQNSPEGFPVPSAVQ